MGYGNKFASAGIALAAFAATAALVFYGNGMMPRWGLMWFAPLPVLLLALRRPAWQAGLVAVAAWMVGLLNLWGYLRALSAPPTVWFADAGMTGLVFAAGVLLMRGLARRGRVYSAWLALPAVWTSFEYGRNLLWPHGSGGSLAYSQLNFVPFLQLASITGPWGMSFVLLLFPAGLALAIHLFRTQRSQALRMLGATLGTVAAVLIYGAVRCSIAQPGPTVKVGLVASDSGGNLQVAHPGAPTQRLLEQYAQHAQELIAHGAQVVVLPENLGVVLEPDTARVDAIFQPIADRTGALLVVGMTYAASRAIQHNEARIYAPGVAVRSYDKEHLLPPFENIYKPGTSRVLFAPPGPAEGRTWGVAICKDLDFTNPARAYGEGGVGLLLAPAWDFRIDGFWHGHIAVMRAVEDGFSLVRTAKNGRLTVADDRGRILAEVSSNAAPFTTLLASAPAGHDWTPFLLLGDWFGWCTMALLILLLGRQLADFVRSRLQTAPRARREHVVSVP